MVYLLESKLPETKQIYLALTHVYGIGKVRSFLICKKLGFIMNLKVRDLSNNQINKISKLIESLEFVISNELRRSNLLTKQNLLNIKSYRGLRRKKGFPVRGQRTHTNAKTARKVR